MFFHENGKNTMYKLAELIEMRKVTSILRHGEWPAGVSPGSFSTQGGGSASFHQRLP